MNVGHVFNTQNIIQIFIVISATRMLPVLRNVSSYVTVLAPTDNAFLNSGIDVDKLEAHGCLDGEK